MKKITLITLFALAILGGCKKADVDPDIPKCIQKQIKQLEECGTCETASVAEFTFQGKTVYAVDFGNESILDAATQIMDSKCNGIGIVGGAASIKEVNGESWSNAVLVRTLWPK